MYLREHGLFLDTRKAINVVWHEGLFVKLHKAGVPRAL